MVSTAVIGLGASEIACLLIKQNNLLSGSLESSPSHKTQDKDLRCYQSSKNIYEAAEKLEVGVLENVEVKAIVNISEKITCLWFFKETQTDCNSSLDLENRQVVSKTFPKIRETQAGNHTLSIKTETNNYRVTFTIYIKKSPRKPHFILNKQQPEVTVSCLSEGYPKPRFEWFACRIPDESCRNSYAVQNEDTGGIQRSQLKLRDNELLFRQHVWCCAINELGKVCTKLYTIDLSVASVSPTQELFLKMGEPLLLRCRAISGDFNFGMKWYSGNKQLIQGMPPEGRKKLNSKRVKIQYAFVSSMEEQGHTHFNCSSKELAAEKSALVTVSDKGFINFTNEKEDFEVDMAENLCLEVTLIAYPSIRCIWMFSQMSFPCNQTYTDVYSISSKFCDHEDKPGEYVFYAENDDLSVSRTLKLYVKGKPVLKMYETPTQISCIAESRPAASWVWRQCPDKKTNCTEITSGISDNTYDGNTFGFQIVNSTLDLSEIEDRFYVECCANNSVGFDCETSLIEKGEHPLYDNVALYATAGFCFSVIAVLCVLICQNYKKQSRYKNQLQMIQMIGPSYNEYIYVDFSEVEYELKWEFPRENLEFGEELGSGAFGKVVNATAYGISETGESAQVAVKMLKDKYSSSEKDALMTELKMMTRIGSHENIVNLLGACTISGPIYLIFEYCCYGDLLNYLRSKRGRFHKTLTDVFRQHNFSFYHNFPQYTNSRNENILRNGSYISKDDFGNTSVKKDSDLASKLCRIALLAEEEGMKYVNSGIDEEEDLNVLTFEDLLSFAYQVARGMEFLESKSCVHRDLAARNILVTHGKVAKICDFGLARDIENDSNYIVRGNARLPVKWMSPESLFQGIYTIKSDVWSYGILLWEIFSLGVNPYPGIQVDANFYKLIQNGFKMDCPFYATEEIYLMLCSCWALDPSKRPSFSQLLSLLAFQLAEAEGAACPMGKSGISEHVSKPKARIPAHMG